MKIVSALNPVINFSALIELKGLISKHWNLLRLLCKKELLDPHAGQMLGAFWSIAQPLFLLMIYAIIFNCIFKVKLGGTYELPLNYTIYVLSGLIPWLAFQQALAKSSIAILSNENLVKQVVFPLEMLPIRACVTSSVIILLGSIFVIFYSFFQLKSFPLIYLMLPIIFVMQICLMTGVAFILSAICVFFKDMKELMQMFLTINIFLIPATYLPESIPQSFRIFVELNPFSHLVWVYQDILYFGRFEHPISWYLFFIVSVLVLAIGFRFFKHVKGYFGNVL